MMKVEGKPNVVGYELLLKCDKIGLVRLGARQNVETFGSYILHWSGEYHVHATSLTSEVIWQRFFYQPSRLCYSCLEQVNWFSDIAFQL
jgi:hypothetical protein